MLVCPVCRLVLSAARCVAHGADGIDVSPDPLHGAHGSRFRVRRPFAVGDTGTCYEAEDLSSKRTGLLKVLRVREDAGRDASEKLTTEIQNQTTLSSAVFFVPIRRAGLDDGAPWLFRDFVPGESLKSRLARNGKLALSDALVITAQVALALHELHSRGLVHRAVRPGHVLLHEDARGTPHALLIEAGMAGRNDRSSALEDLGDLFYMPPEIARGDKVGFRADLYSLGCTLYDMLVGEPPFDGDDADAVVYGHLYHPPAIPHDELPGSIATLLEQMLAKAPFDRPLSAQQILREIDPFLPEDWQSPPHSAPRPAVRPPAPRPAVSLASVAPPAPAPRPAVSLASVAPPRASSAPVAARPSTPAPARASSMPAPPPAVPLARVATPAPAPIPLSQPRAVAPEARALPTYTREADIPTPKLSSIATAELDAYDEALSTKRARGSRFPRGTVGFVLGCATTLAATWALAYTGNFHVVTHTLTTHLAVPRAMIQTRVPATSEVVPEPQPAATLPPTPEPPAAPAPVAVPTAVQTPAESQPATDTAPPAPGTETAATETSPSEPEGEPAETATAAADTDPDDEASTADDDEPRMTRAQRRRALRQARLERRRARIRARNRARRIAARRRARAEARRDSTPDLLF